MILDLVGWYDEMMIVILQKSHCGYTVDILLMVCWEGWLGGYYQHSR